MVTIVPVLQNEFVYGPFETQIPLNHGHTSDWQTSFRSGKLASDSTNVELTQMKMENASKYIDSHCDWNLDQSIDNRRNAVLQQLTIHLRDNPELFKIPALLFQAYIYAFYRKQVDEKGAEKALALLEQTHEEIEKYARTYCTCKDNSIGTKSCESAQGALGFRIVCDTLIANIQKNKTVVEECYHRLDRSLRDRTEVSNAYIYGTRAFAISRLGPSRAKESMKFFIKAGEICRTNTDWLFGHALLYGRITRQSTIGLGIPREESGRSRYEKKLYDQILRIDSRHTLAKLFKAQVLFNENHRKQAEDTFRELLEDEHSHTNLEVLNRSIVFFREFGNFRKARELIDEAELIEDKDAFFYHQKALTCIGEYRQDKLETGISKSQTNLLEEALFALKQATDTRDSVDFVKDRVWAYQELGKEDEIKKELQRNYERTESEELWDIDVISICILYGNFFLRKYGQQASANKETLSNGLDLLKRAIGVSCANKNIKDAMVKHLCNKNLTTGILQDIYDAIFVFEKHNMQCIEHHENEAEALQNMKWLQQILKPVPIIFQETGMTQSDEDLFEHTDAHHKQHADETREQTTLQTIKGKKMKFIEKAFCWIKLFC